MKARTKTEDVRIQIAGYLENNGIKRKWLAKQIGISLGHLHYILKEERELTEVNLAKINVALETNFVKNEQKH